MQDPKAKRHYVRSYGQNPIVLAKCKCGDTIDRERIEIILESYMND